jgi:hypothetical protein
VKNVHVTTAMASGRTAGDLVIITNGFAPITGETTQILKRCR